jgi:cytochrome c
MKHLWLVLLATAACRGDNAGDAFAEPTGGSSDHGHALIVEKGCSACHSIPGVRAPGGLVAPPLAGIARRTFLAGEIPNTPENLIRWLHDPHAIEATTAMPSTGLSREEARDVAAYLYTLD